LIDRLPVINVDNSKLRDFFCFFGSRSKAAKPAFRLSFMKPQRHRCPLHATVRPNSNPESCNVSDVGDKSPSQWLSWLLYIAYQNRFQHADRPGIRVVTARQRAWPVCKRQKVKATQVS